MATTTANYNGTIQGQFSIDSNGGATYTVPLPLPPGTAGMMPALSLVYNSGGGNGLLGVGWSLQGLSSIMRTPATIAQDDFIGAVNYDSNDRFALDGQRLIPIQGSTYQDPSAVYHTEIEGWKKVVPLYNQPPTPNRNGPDAFTVYTKDGKCLEYGTSSDAQIPASSDNSSIRVWALNKLTDLNGNFLTITYQEDSVNNSFYPLCIEYTGNSGTGLAPQRSVQLSYEPRPDSVPQYLGGYKVEATQRLSAVQTFLDGQRIMTYSFAYQQGKLTGRSQLVSITQSDADGVALPPTVVAWQDGDPAIFGTAQSLPSTQRILGWHHAADGRER